MEAAAAWVATHGAAHGFRPPNVCERPRALGLAGYFAELGLPEGVLFDGQGNAFDRSAVLSRAGSSVAAWLEGADLPRSASPPAE